MSALCCRCPGLLARAYVTQEALLGTRRTEEAVLGKSSYTRPLLQKCPWIELTAPRAANSDVVTVKLQHLDVSQQRWVAVCMA